jgi:hypothetical protein
VPHQNRLDPFGNFHAVPARGQLMGNRGILHDGDKRLVRMHAHRNWIACELCFKGRRREIMAPGRYTELFFLDEATAFAAGHRPCAECRRERYNEFTRYWQRLYGSHEAGGSLAQTIDRTLHAHRIARGGRKITFEAFAEDLPNGTIFAMDGGAVLVWNGRMFDWSFDDYTKRLASVRGAVTVLTPRPLVELFSRGFAPLVHNSADG